MVIYSIDMKVVNGMYRSLENRKAVPGYEGLYEVSDKGKVYRNGFELEPIQGKYVTLSKNSVQQKVKICYLVARAFLPNMEMRKYVRHKDGDTTNNRVENLFWDEEPDHISSQGAPNAEKAVLRIGADGVGVVRYGSIREAAEQNRVSRQAIQQALNGKTKTCKGFVWRYEAAGRDAK